ncbi:MAG TPA: hypothetical protein H9957_10865, partial [Candidatus Dorea stercoravium]|nr:hypothetical protein [Candidatus Dorea stercoravium]
MENTSENKEIAKGKERVKRISLGILAHVDAGKTTLSEALLYLSGAIRKAGSIYSIIFSSCCLVLFVSFFL